MSAFFSNIFFNLFLQTNERIQANFGFCFPATASALCEAGFKFEVKLKHIEEIWPQEMPAEQVPEYLAGLKAAAFTGELNPGELLITADTVVCLDNVILGNPGAGGSNRYAKPVIGTQTYSGDRGMPDYGRTTAKFLSLYRCVF